MNLENLASDTVSQILKEGIKQGHSPNSWKNEPLSFHLLKGIRHATSAMLLIQHPDLPCSTDEDAIGHLERSLCRMAMALYVLKMKGEE